MRYATAPKTRVRPTPDPERTIIAIVAYYHRIFAPLNHANPLRSTCGRTIRRRQIRLITASFARTVCGSQVLKYTEIIPRARCPFVPCFRTKPSRRPDRKSHNNAFVPFGVFFFFSILFHPNLEPKFNFNQRTIFFSFGF